MKTITNNTAAILSDLLGRIQNFNASILIDPNDSISPAFMIKFGIRSLILNAGYKSEMIIKDVAALFTNCQIISFANWSDLYGASDLWDGLLLDVIKPLRKKDFEFVFYLGDPTKKLAQEVDEILDIISEYSLYGRVTLALDEEEATKLWMVLNGYDPGMSLSSLKLPCPGEKYLSIFNTMNVNHLLIYGIDQTLSFSKQEHVELVPGSHKNARIAMDVRNNFNAGYSLGLQLQLEISQCVALGLAVSGSYVDNGIIPDRNALLSYIKKWMTESGASHLVLD